MAGKSAYERTYDCSSRSDDTTVLVARRIKVEVERVRKNVRRLARCVEVEYCDTPPTRRPLQDDGTTEGNDQSIVERLHRKDHTFRVSYWMNLIALRCRCHDSRFKRK
jgi:hypothetical protein